MEAKLLGASIPATRPRQALSQRPISLFALRTTGQSLGFVDLKPSKGFRCSRVINAISNGYEFLNFYLFIFHFFPFHALACDSVVLVWLLNLLWLWHVSFVSVHAFDVSLLENLIKLVFEVIYLNFDLFFFFFN